MKTFNTGFGPDDFKMDIPTYVSQGPMHPARGLGEMATMGYNCSACNQSPVWFLVCVPLSTTGVERRTICSTTMRTELYGSSISNRHEKLDEHFAASPPPSPHTRQHLHQMRDHLCCNKKPGRMGVYEAGSEAEEITSLDAYHRC